LETTFLLIALLIKSNDNPFGKILEKIARPTVIFADQMMYMGFQYSTKSGISFCSNDMTIPDTKASMVDEAQAQVKEVQKQYSHMN
jgi:DNA-directed RNA polymerase beta' subunit